MQFSLKVLNEMIIELGQAIKCPRSCMKQKAKPGQLCMAFQILPAFRYFQSTDFQPETASVLPSVIYRWIYR